MTTDDLADDGVLVEVHWSSVNYKDGLASTPTGKVARISPMVPGSTSRACSSRMPVTRRPAPR